MNLTKNSCVVVGAVLLLAVAPVYAQEAAPAAALINEDVGVPVFPHDIPDRPYQVIGEVKAPVRKTTIFSKAPDQRKIYHELWERGQKLGADAVINAKYGDARVTAISWGEVAATGTAIKFTAAPAPVAAPAPAEPAAPPAASH